MMGRPCKPTVVLEMSGAFKKNPQRRLARQNEPPTPRLFESAPPPQFLIQAPATGYQQAERWLREWKELEREAPHMGYQSRGSVITLCMIKAELWRLPTGDRRLEVLSDRENKLRSALGLTETSRPKVDTGNFYKKAGSGSGSVIAELAREARESAAARAAGEEEADQEPGEEEVDQEVWEEADQESRERDLA